MADWRRNPVTRKVRQYLKDYRQDLMEQWALGDIAGESNNFYRGVAEAFRQIEDISYDNFKVLYGLDQDNKEESDESEAENSVGY